MNTIEFHKTTTKELKAVQDRIRNLVPNWLEDGMYKEAVLRGVIKNFLPKNFEIASGYVVRPTINRGTHNVSKQIDIIIYDNNYPLLFQKEELVVVTADSVRAIIEVKSSDQDKSIVETLKKSNDKGRFIFEGKENKELPLFNGIFYYTGNNQRKTRFKKDLLQDKMRISKVSPANNFIVDHIAYGENIFFKFWKGEIDGKTRNYLYYTPDLSFSFFISNLMSYLQPGTVKSNDFLWFPIDRNSPERKIEWHF